MRPPNINHFYAGLIIEYLIFRGIDYIGISPGSRSTPLTVAAARQDALTVKMHTDERGSGFMAVGYAAGSGRIPALICTSGTAVANFFPSVIEAWQAQLPLIILTADRPEELQNCGANQTIDQRDIFGRFTQASITLGTFDSVTEPRQILSSLSGALDLLHKGPVHINCRFREPLAPTDEPYEFEALSTGAKDWYKANSGQSPAAIDYPAPEVSEIVQIINDSAGGLIVAGPEIVSRQCSRLNRLARKLNWPILTDIYSQHRFGQDRSAVLGHHDLYLDIEDAAGDLTPDIVLHIGGLPTSRRLNRYLLDLKGIEYIKIQNHDRTIDPDRLETKRLIGDPDNIIDRLLPELNTRPEDYLQKWRSVEDHCAIFLPDWFGDDRLTEPSLAHSLGKLIPDSSALFLSSSMPIRDAESFITVRSADIAIGSNRGASGIDGVIASACGFAAGIGRPTTLLIGDLAFLHDLGSLALAKDSASPVIIIVINNRGGGIFHFLPIAEHEDIFESYFGTPHDLTFESAAEMFDLPYNKPMSLTEFESSYKSACREERSVIIEITTDRRQNAAEHDTIRLQLRKRLSASEVRK